MPFAIITPLAAHPLVHLNAALNAAATVLLVVGLWQIKRKRVSAHGRTMLLAFAVSAGFLCSYLYYHSLVGSVKFTHPGPVRYVYYTILLTHVVLAFFVPFLATGQLYLGLRAIGWWPGAGLEGEQRIAAARYRDKHCRLARWTYPIWLYASVTGVVVYAMLYHLWPPVG